MQHHRLNRDMVKITIRSADRWTVLISQRFHGVSKVKRGEGLTEEVIMKSSNIISSKQSSSLSYHLTLISCKDRTTEIYY